MCNIAGYIGKREAAGVLIEMMRREEGFGGGYYTGMTVSDGKKLHTDKVVGDLSHLLAETECAGFKGNVGMIHSRSNSGGGVAWGHPFISRDGRTSLIANGIGGCFVTPERTARQIEIANELDSLGYVFGSRTEGEVKGYPTLADGTSVHSSDIYAQRAAYYADRGHSPAEALAKTLTDVPCEVVLMSMQEEYPESIFTARISFPMVVGIADDGDTYLATTALAFPEDVNFRSITLLEPLKAYEIRKGEIIEASEAVDIGDAAVAPIDEETVNRAMMLALEALGEIDEPMTVDGLIEAILPAFPEGKIPQGSPLAYEVMYRLRDLDVLEIVRVRAEGPCEGYFTDNFRLELK
jgi:glucosamine 6-phosphate synthetase-like amidotransferase/phosphosugar isomerase protein